MEQWFSKSVILKDFDINKTVHEIPQPKDMSISFRQSENQEVYAILQGSKFHINKYLQQTGKHLLSERSRHFANLPKYHFYNTEKRRVF